MRPFPRYTPGDMIGGRYQVHQVKMGGMGEVYLCLDLEEMYPYALKTFQQRYQSSALRKAFEQEVATWVALEKHPNIVRCFYMDILDNQPFMILEWIVGETDKGSDLRSWLRHGPLELQTALDFTIDIVRGMIHAQEKQPGLVHRDLKPENILIAQGGLAKVSDFGLAQIIELATLEFEGESEGRQSLVREGNIAGTPVYMAPEQWRGEPLDERVDIYAIGCILYEMLSGRWPFQVNFTPTTPQEFRQWLDEMQTQHETKSLAILPDGLPESVTNLLQACLAKVPTKRPSGMVDLLAQVETVYRQHFNQSPLTSLPPTAFTSSDYTNRGATYDNLKQYELALADYERAIELDPTNVIAYNNRGNVYICIGDYDNALVDLNRAIERDPDIAQFYVTRGRIHQLIGDTVINEEAGVLHYRASLADCEQAIQIEPTSAQAYVQRGVGYDRLGDLKNALVDFGRALEMDPVNAGIYVNRGAVYDKLQRYEDALIDYSRAIELSSSDEQSQRLVYSNRALTYIKMGSYDSAISDFEYVLKVAPLDPQTYLNLGFLYAQRGRLWSALPYFEKAVQLGDLASVQVVARTRRLLGLPDNLQSDIFQEVFEAFKRVSSINEMQQFLIKYPFVTDTDLLNEIRQNLKKVFQEALQAFEQVSSINEMQQFLINYPFVTDADFLKEIWRNLEEEIRLNRFDPDRFEQIRLKLEKEISFDQFDIHFEWINQIIAGQIKEKKQ